VEEDLRCLKTGAKPEKKVAGVKMNKLIKCAPTSTSNVRIVCTPRCTTDINYDSIIYIDALSHLVASALDIPFLSAGS
jgi:hypothetical protein